MKIGKNISFYEGVFSSIAGAGPLVNFAILISYAYIYAGNFMFISFSFAFLLYIFFMNTIYQLSKNKVGSGVYYLFLKDHGFLKNFIHIYFIYVFSSFVSILLFLNFIFVPLIFNVPIIFSYLTLFSIIIIIMILIRYGFRSSLLYISIGSLLEILFILIFSLFLILHVNYINLKYPSFFDPEGIFIGSLFSVLVFAGIGSTVSFGDVIKNPYVNVKKSIFTSTMIEGTVFIFASLAVSLFLLSENIFILPKMNIPIWGLVGKFRIFFIPFSILLLNSFFSILVIYGISLSRTFHRTYEKNISYEKSLYISFLIIFLLILFFIFSFGPINGFLLATSIATFNWLIFHDSLNLILIKRFYLEKKNILKNLLLPALAIIFSALIFYYMLISLTFPFYLAPISTLILFLIYFLFKIFSKISKNY
ncbi:MAG: hypothetical protein ACP5SF_00685 [Thermoplasmata archaeon]